MKAALRATSSTVISRFIDIVARRDFQVAELQGAIIAVVWGVWITFPGMRDPYLCADLARGMAPQIWGLALVVFGLGQLSGLLFDVFWLRRNCAFVAGIFWFFVAIFIALQSPVKVACPTAFAFSGTAFWGYVRMRGALG